MWTKLLSMQLSASLNFPLTMSRYLLQHNLLSSTEHYTLFRFQNKTAQAYSDRSRGTLSLLCQQLVELNNATLINSLPCLCLQSTADICWSKTVQLFRRNKVGFTRSDIFDCLCSQCTYTCVNGRESNSSILIYMWLEYYISVVGRRGVLANNHKKNKCFVTRSTWNSIQYPRGTITT
jgi:hypothetical protein